MNQNQNGKLEYKTSYERLNEFEKELDLFIISHQNADIEYILSLNKEQIEKLSTQDCISYSLLLNRYALYLQKVSNRLNNKVRWATHNMNIIIGKEANNYGTTYSKFDERALMVKTQNTYAIALNKIVLEEGAKLAELEFLASKIQAIAKSLTLGKVNYEYNRNS